MYNPVLKNRTKIRFTVAKDKMTKNRSKNRKKTSKTSFNNNQPQVKQDLVKYGPNWGF